MTDKVKILVLTNTSQVSEMKDYLSRDTDLDIAIITTDPGEIMIKLANDKSKKVDAVLIDNSSPGTEAELFIEISEYGCTAKQT